jgi:hypothetical protein
MYPKRTLRWMPLALCLVLVGCGGGREGQAIDACTKGIADKLGNKTFKLDTADMHAKAQVDGDTISISSSIVLDPGLPVETTQTFECKARFANGAASVLSLNFIW